MKAMMTPDYLKYAANKKENHLCLFIFTNPISEGVMN